MTGITTQTQTSFRSLRSRVLGVLCFVPLVAGLQSCKQPEQNSVVESAPGEDRSEIEVLTATRNTVIKAAMVQSSVLGTGDACPIPQGTILVATSLKPTGVDHLRLFSVLEVKLPSGEVGRVTALQTSASPLTAVPSGAGTSPASASSSDAPLARSDKTPVELLNCELLKSDAVYVFSQHFTRQKVTSIQTQQASAADTAESAADSNESSFGWPTRGRKIRNDSGGSGYFNAPRGSGRGHQGLDVEAAVGEPIFASKAGTIIDPAYEFSYGKVLDVKHTGGYLTRYAHLTSFSYSHGVYVEKGAKIATAGRTGNASGYGITPHLHFEIRQYNRLLNPLKQLR